MIGWIVDKSLMQDSHDRRRVKLGRSDYRIFLFSEWQGSE